jgi:APA family basic amino acid/polyamine antiporter
VPHTPAQIKKQLMDGTRLGATPVTHGVALPHLRIEGLNHAQLAMVRSRPGIHITFQDPMSDRTEEHEAMLHAVFFLMSPLDNPGQHLRILAEIAGRVDDETFAADWDGAEDEHGLKEALLRGERYLTLLVRAGDPSEQMIGRPVRELSIPQGCLITWLRRGSEVLIPRGSTVIEEGDRLTVIGEPADIEEFARRFVENPR